MKRVEPTEVIRAAGALLWRHCHDHYEIAVVHRNRHDDWTLPKGKLNQGESWEHAAHREVEEETGFDARFLDFAGALAYEADGKPKIVRYWHMLAQGDTPKPLDNEVDVLLWLPVDKAIERLKYPLEKALVEQFDSPKGLDGPQRKSRTWLPDRVSLRRLGITLETFEPELEARIGGARLKSGNDLNLNWIRASRQLLDLAKRAHRNKDADRGWRCLTAADRFSFYGLSFEGLKQEASVILAEASDEGKDLSGWRRTAIRQSLADDNGALKSSLEPENVIRAKRILDEQQDNVYHKLHILQRRLELLSVISLFAVGVWILWSPLSPTITVNPLLDGIITPGTRLWVAVILTGILGALVSGFLTSMARDQKQARIPAEVLATTVTFARISVAVLSSLAISIFLLSGLLNMPNPSPGLLLAVAFASGFSDRLLLRALDSLSSKGVPS